ncbi:MAG: hypothetical protein HYX72_08060 [Acidobacteria bacterium]|nr:hypothetical protein [Acidobacteriota bacterium]
MFTLNQQGSAQGAVLIANTAALAAPIGSIAGRESLPAQRGEFVTIYCSGLGDATNRPATGAAAADASSVTIQPVAVTIGGVASPPRATLLM